MNNLIKEMAYPTEFSLDTLKKLPHYSKRLAYVESHLEKIASGSSRTVYFVDETKVLKVAKNKKGLAQNRIESDYSLQNYDIVAKVFDSDEEDIFVEMEFAYKVKPTEFERIVGISIDDLSTFLRNVYYENHGIHHHTSDKDYKKWHDKQWENEWIAELVEVCINYGFTMPGDFGRLSSYGRVIRNGEEKIVLIDFGLTEDIWKEYYSK